MRVDTSLLDGINAANAAAKASSASLKSSGTTTAFSSALKAATDKETTKAVPGKNYAEILTGPRAGMYLNTSGNARDGEAFVLVKHDGREDHIYGTGDDRKVVRINSGSETAEKTSTSSPPPAEAPAGERTTPVQGHAYADILNGTRSGLYLNTSGNVRDGQAFVLVRRDGREYHIYGTGNDKVTVSMKMHDGDKPMKAADAAKTPTDTSSSSGATVPTTPLVTDSLS